MTDGKRFTLSGSGLKAIRDSKTRQDPEWLRFKQIGERVLQAITPETIGAFYAAWREVKGNESPKALYKELLVPAKKAIVMDVLRRAKAAGWVYGYSGDVLYVDTPFGQVSWHGDYGPAPVYPGEWSGVRHSDTVLQQLYASTPEEPRHK
jgi:hypothetical protein